MGTTPLLVDRIDVYPGFFSWLAFLYIGLTARHSRWMLWALVYATPLIVLLIFAGFQVPHNPGRL
jgi:hypothetical protein